MPILDAATASAEALHLGSRDKGVEMGLEVGLLGLVLLVLCVWAVISIVQSGASAFAKAVWIVAMLVFPFVGFLVWLLFGPKGRRT